MAAPAVGILFAVFVGEGRFKGATMQVHLDHIAGRKAVLRQVGEKQFVDHPSTGDADWARLGAGGMCGHDHAVGSSFRSHRNLGAIVEAANQLAFGTLLELIRRQVQACLNQGVIQHAVVFTASYKREARHIGKHRAQAILAIQP